MIDFSIIIPVKNEENRIDSCLKSIFANSYPGGKYEVIVVDNGSDDSTVCIAESYTSFVYKKPDVSISALRNFGVQKARGKILAFIDADCTVSENWLKEARKYIKKNDVVCFGSPPVIPEKPTWVQSTWFKVRRKHGLIKETSWLESMNMFVRKDVFLKIKGFNESLITCEDVDLSYRLSKHGKIISDFRIKAVHHGEAKNIGEFFCKEKWRGKSNYKGIIQHGIRIDELPSIILPLYYGIIFFSILVLLFTFRFTYAAAVILVWQMPVLLIAKIKLRNQFAKLDYIRLIFLYNVYYCARFFSII